MEFDRSVEIHFGRNDWIFRVFAVNDLALLIRGNRAADQQCYS